MKTNLNKRIAIYYGPGSSKEYVDERWVSFIPEITLLKNTEFTKKNLRIFDILILPGGSGSKQCNALCKRRKQNIVNWVINGGTIIGVCAGMYSLLKGYDWSLGLLDFSVVDKSNWNRGEFPVNLKISSDGQKFLNLNEDRLIDVPYHNGPVVKKLNFEDENVSNEKILATFENDNLENSVAIILCEYGKGKVIALSPHLEADENYKKIVLNLIQKL